MEGPLIRARLWDLFQVLVGNNPAKCRALENIGTPARVLEIGCATGNVARVFTNTEYVGIDLEADRVALATRRFRNKPRMEFQCVRLESSSLEAASFNMVVLSHAAHHMSDGVLRDLLQRSAELLVPGGELVVLDMVRPEPSDPLRKRFYYMLDRGEHFRTADEFVEFFGALTAFEPPRLEIVETRKFGIRVIDQILVRSRRCQDSD